MKGRTTILRLQRTSALLQYEFDGVADCRGGTLGRQQDDAQPLESPVAAIQREEVLKNQLHI